MRDYRLLPERLVNSRWKHSLSALFGLQRENKGGLAIFCRGRCECLRIHDNDIFEFPQVVF